MLEKNNEYLSLVNNIRLKIKEAQYKALTGVNEKLINLYWEIGTELNKSTSYGNSYIDSLAKDIKSTMPNVKGFSARNLRYMKKFAKEITDLDFLQTVSAKLPWSHNLILLEKLNTMEERVWYGAKTIENAWSVTVLEHQVATKLYSRQSSNNKIQNFDLRLPAAQSELAVQTMKDPYIFDFVEFREEMLERDIENELVSNITKFLLEMGSGFAYMGHQYPLVVDGEEFALDLLFYNTNLHCYIVIDLKTKKFKPEYAGKMNFYLSVIDDQLKKEHDNPSIGLILCRDENKLIAEYALKDMSKPIGVSEYLFTQELPDELKNTLPKTQELAEKIFKEKNK